MNEVKKRKNKKELGAKEVFGLLKPYIDVHTLGLSSIKNLLNECGYKVIMASEDVSEAVVFIQKINSLSKVKQWIIDNNITRLGFSYRLDPYEAKDYFCSLYYQLKNAEMFSNAGGCIKSVFFAGLPDACDLIKKEFNEEVVVFKGGETPLESLEMLGVPPEKFIKTLSKNDAYDKMLLEFGNQLITSGKYKYIKPQDHYMYKTCGTDNDSYLDRLMYCKKRKTLPLIRAHVGPYSSDRLEAVKEFMSWVKQLAGFGLLDILSIGTSQLTQSNFGEIWDGLPNGGGVPINYEHEYVAIKEAAKPMLVRTYAGTKNIPAMAELHERSLNISWHALSFWWFCEIDNRGKNTVLENLKEHIETIKYIAQTGKPLEINVPHHFAFRGSDDITYILSSYLTAKTAKKYGIKHLIVQNMLNTPKSTWGIHDLAKSRAMLRLVRELEDDKFKISLQTRAGLDFFSPDLEKAKIQLAAVTALMDDIEPENNNSPQIIHVVSYSEAIRLANPTVINESIQITLSALKEYRLLRSWDKVPNMAYDKEVIWRTEEMYSEAKDAIAFMEQHIPNLYSYQGLYEVFNDGYFPVPFIIDQNNTYPKARMFTTAVKKGGVKVVDEKGQDMKTLDRYKKIFNEK